MLMKSRAIIQFLYDLDYEIQRARHQPSRIVRIVSTLARALVRPLSVLLPRSAIVSGRAWRTRLLMRADHHLPYIVDSNPLWSQPLVHAVEATDKTPVRIVDVGANIGDTVAMLDACSQRTCEFLCIEADDSFFELGTENTKRARSRVQWIRGFVGDLAGAAVVIEHGVPGTATSRMVEAHGEQAETARIVPLDEMCADFASRGGIDLLKVDTDGFDFKVLRSGRELIRKFRPLVFFEWAPTLWTAQQEDPLSVFAFLGDLGYSYFSFYSDNGFHYADVELPAAETLRSLLTVSLARNGIDNLHFDVLTGPAGVCQKAAQLNSRAVQDLRERYPIWLRLGPAYWR